MIAIAPNRRLFARKTTIKSLSDLFDPSISRSLNHASISRFLNENLLDILDQKDATWKITILRSPPPDAASEDFRTKLGNAAEISVFVEKLHGNKLYIDITTKQRLGYVLMKEFSTGIKIQKVARG